MRIFKNAALLLVAVCSFISCQKDETGEVAMQSAEEAALVKQLDAAKQWFESQKSIGKTRSVDNRQNLYEGDPSWKYFAVNEKGNLTAVDVDLTDRISMEFVPQENIDAYRQTGNRDFRRSYTRLVYTTDKKTHQEKGFLMTIVPSKYYAKTYSKRVRLNTYLQRDKYLSGYVLFHRLNGQFVNGWEYKRGQVIRKVYVKKRGDVLGKGAIAVNIVAAKYSVTPKVHSQAQTRWGSEEGWYDDSFWLPEVVITPDPDYDYPEWDNSGWVDYPDYGTDPDDENYDNDGMFDDTVDYSEDNPDAEFDQIVENLKRELMKLGIDVSKLSFAKTDECFANARIKNGIIELCALFFQWGEKTKLAIVWHEANHLKNDKPCTTNFVKLDSPIIRNPPFHIEVIMRAAIAKESQSALYQETAYKSGITFTIARDPAFVQNEVDCYNAEVEMFPSNTLDKDYADNRAMMQWVYEQELDIANNYYNKK